MPDWTEKEIQKAAEILAKAEEEKHAVVRLIEELMHWGIFFVVLIGNLVIDIFLVFSSGLLDHGFFWLLVVVAGLSFGLLIDVPLRDIEKIHKGKHTLSKWFLIVLAVINIPVIAGIRGLFSSNGVEIALSALLLGIVYGVCFLLPHYWYLAEKRGYLRFPDFF